MEIHVYKSYWHSVFLIISLPITLIFSTQYYKSPWNDGNAFKSYKVNDEPEEVAVETNNNGRINNYEEEIGADGKVKV